MATPVVDVLRGPGPWISVSARRLGPAAWAQRPRRGACVITSVPDMEITDTPRTPAERKRRLLERLERERDVWVATADGAGVPCLVALWFAWDGRALWVSTRLTNPTGRDLRQVGRARVAFGDTRDLVLVDGEVDAFPAPEAPEAAVAGLRAKYGWDPRGDSASYAFYRIRPRTVQAYRGEHEMCGRFLMRDGVWVV